MHDEGSRTGIADGDNGVYGSLQLPLGQGVAKTEEMLKTMRAAGFAGPISIHFEYKTPSNGALLEEMRKAVATLRGYLKTAGYA